MADTLKSLLPDGPISAWPDYADEPDEEWTIGVVTTGIFGPGRPLREGDRPSCWMPIATVRGKKFAQALAKHLSSLT